MVEGGSLLPGGCLLSGGSSFQLEDEGLDTSRRGGLLPEVGGAAESKVPGGVIPETALGQIPLPCEAEVS